MSIWEFVNLLVENDMAIAVYDCRLDKEIYCGKAYELIYEDIRECEIISIDICPREAWGPAICLNIETEDELEEED